MSVKRYRTKPMEVEAIQWTGENKDEVEAFVTGALIDFLMKLNARIPIAVYIHTSKGYMIARHGDYIVKLADDDYYSCKPDVFKQKYEEIEG